MEGPHLEESVHLCVYAVYVFSFSLVMFADIRLQLLAMIIKHDEPDANKFWEYPALVIK